MSRAGTWTPEQLENAMRYGCCHNCGSPREAYLDKNDVIELPHTRTVIDTGIRCPNGCLWPNEEWAQRRAEAGQP